MGVTSSQIQVEEAARLRLRTLVFPREHGAWGLLLIPFAVGTLVGLPLEREHGISGVLLLLAAAMALFCARTPVESCLGLSAIKARTAYEKRVTLWAMVLLLPVAATSLALLFRLCNAGALIAIGMVAATALALQGVLRQWGRPTRMLSQAVGAIALTATAASAYYVVTGRLDRTAIGLWFVCWLFAGDQIHYVQVRLRTVKVSGAAPRAARAWSFLAGQVVMLALVAALEFFALLPVWTVVAFLPAVLRGVFWLRERGTSVDVPWLGLTELLHGITFGALLTSVYYLHR